MDYVIYYRVSTKKQGESGLGLEAQKSYVQHFVETKAIIKEYKEVATAKYMDCNNRPQLCDAIQFCNENGYTLVVAKIDRLSRTTEHALDIYNRLEGRLFSCDIPQMDKFTLTLFMAIADRERDLISLRTKQALAEKKKRGAILGTPSNLTNRAREKAWAANKKKAATNKANIQAKEMIRLYKGNGLTLQAIANHLNEQGYRTSRGNEFQPTTVKRLHGMR
jgi:DNA invertase Pin-like site-specific DNA recombinase